MFLEHLNFIFFYAFAKEIFENNYINKSEDFNAKLLENEFNIKGKVNDYHINELNQKIN